MEFAIGRSHPGELQTRSACRVRSVASGRIQGSGCAGGEVEVKRKLAFELVYWWDVVVVSVWCCGGVSLLEEEPVVTVCGSSVSGLVSQTGEVGLRLPAWGLGLCCWFLGKAGSL